MSNVEKKDILFQIDMQLYDDLEKLEKETEIKLLRKAIEKQQKEIEELKKYKKYYEEMEEVNKKFISVDKIKAKIEQVKDGTFDAEIILHQLLEKE